MIFALLALKGGSMVTLLGVSLLGSAFFIPQHAVALSVAGVLTGLKGVGLVFLGNHLLERHQRIHAQTKNA